MDRSTWIFAGGGVLLIALSVTTTVLYVKQPTAGSIRQRLANAEKRYKCSQCGNEFPCAFVPLDANSPAEDPDQAHRPDCPSCKARHTGWLMTICLECGKHYVPPTPDPNGLPFKNVCPYCSTDQSKWYDEHVKDAAP